MYLAGLTNEETKHRQMKITTINKNSMDTDGCRCNKRFICKLNNLTLLIESTTKYNIRKVDNTKMYKQ